MSLSDLPKLWTSHFSASKINRIFFAKNIKVNSVKEACAKCFAVHILKFEILKTTWKKWNKEYQTLSFQLFINKYSILMLFDLFFMWFIRFQILIYEPLSIWHKLLVLSCLYIEKSLAKKVRTSFMNVPLLFLAIIPWPCFRQA